MSEIFFEFWQRSVKKMTKIERDLSESLFLSKISMKKSSHTFNLGLFKFLSKKKRIWRREKTFFNRKDLILIMRNFFYHTP